MTFANELEYYERRERQERAFAAKAIDPAIAAIHTKMAEDYAVLVEQGRIAKRQPVGRSVTPPPASAPPPPRTETVRQLAESLVSRFGVDTPSVVACQIKVAIGDARATWEAIGAHLASNAVLPAADV